MINEDQVRISPLAAAALQKNKEGAEGSADAGQVVSEGLMASQPAFEQPTSAQADRERMNVKEKEKQAYNDYIKQVTPTKSLWWQMCKAFLVGGFFCVLGQIILNTCESMGLEKETSASWASLLLILLSVLLTGFHLYQCIAAWAGAGALVPITGFANSVASPAIEYKTEGQVFGIGVKIFTIAGPVILYGIFTSWLLGVFYWLGRVLGIV